MRPIRLLLTLALLPLAGAAQAAPRYDRSVHIITSDYNQVDTTYIDRGRLDGVRVGDRFRVEFPDGKVVTDVVVTSVFERMAAVKIVDSWFLKNGQIAGFHQRPMVIPVEPIARRSAPRGMRLHPRRNSRGKTASVAPGATQAPAAPAASTPAGAAPSSPALAPPPALNAAPSQASSATLPPPPDAGAAPSQASSAALPPPPDAGAAPSQASSAALPPPPDAGAQTGGGDAAIPPPPE